MSKNIREQIATVKADTCASVCKYAEAADFQAKSIHGKDQTLRQEIIEIIQKDLSRHCEVCPLTRL